MGQVGGKGQILGVEARNGVQPTLTSKSGKNDYHSKDFKLINIFLAKGEGLKEGGGGFASPQSLAVENAGLKNIGNNYNTAFKVGGVASGGQARLYKMNSTHNQAHKM